MKRPTEEVKSVSFERKERVFDSRKWFWGKQTQLNAVKDSGACVCLSEKRVEVPSRLGE